MSRPQRRSPATTRGNEHAGAQRDAGGRTTGNRGARPSGERGIALLVVLWIIAGATFLVVSFNATVRSGLSFVSSEVGLSKADAVLDAGLEIAAARLIDEEEGRRWLPDGIPREIIFADRKLKIRISDPNGLVDLNKADEEFLLEFFKHFTDTPSRARTIRDDIKAARDDAAKSGTRQFCIFKQGRWGGRLRCRQSAPIHGHHGSARPQGNDAGYL